MTTTIDQKNPPWWGLELQHQAPKNLVQGSRASLLFHHNREFPHLLHHVKAKNQLLGDCQLNSMRPEPMWWRRVCDSKVIHTIIFNVDPLGRKELMRPDESSLVGIVNATSSTLSASSREGRIINNSSWKVSLPAKSFLIASSSLTPCEEEESPP